MSQSKQIFNYMESGRSLTQAKSTRLFKCTRLAARIYDLKPVFDANGFVLETRTEIRGKAHYSRYRLLGPFKGRKGIARKTKTTK